MIINQVCDIGDNEVSFMMFIIGGIDNDFLATTFSGPKSLGRAAGILFND